MANLAFNNHELQFVRTNNGELNARASAEQSGLTADFAWVFTYISEKRDEIYNRHFKEGGAMTVVYSPKRQKEDPRNPNHPIRPAGTKIRTIVDIVIPKEEGGDGISHTWTYFERKKTDGRSGEVLYTTKNTGYKLHFKKSMIIPYSEIWKAVFLAVLCPQTGKNKDFEIADRVMSAKESLRIRRLQGRLYSLLLDQDTRMSDDDIRRIAGGEYKMRNAETADIDVVINDLYGAIESKLKKTKNDLAKQLEILEQFEEACKVDFFSKRKYMTMRAIENKAVLRNKTAGGNSFWHFNEGTKEKPLKGGRVCMIRIGADELETLYTHLFIDDNKDAVNKIKRFLDSLVPSGSEKPAEDLLEPVEDEPGGDLEVEDYGEMEMSKLRAVYVHKTGKNISGKYINNREWLVEKLEAIA